MVTPRDQHVGTNSTQLDASFGDPAAIVTAQDAEPRLNQTETAKQKETHQ